MKKFTQLMGFLRVGMSFIWIAVLGAGLVYGLRGFAWAEVQFVQILTTTTKNIADIRLLLVEITDIVDRVDESVGTIEHATIDASLALGATRPLLDETSQVVVQDVPTALDDVQASMPSVVEAAASIDDTLRVLSKFRFTVPNLFGDDWEISLGIDYDPEVPLELALLNLSSNLEEMPASMRGMENDLDNADENLALMGDDLMAVATDLDRIRAQMADINPQMNVIIANLSAVEESIAASQNEIPATIDLAQKVFVVVLALLIISQLPAAYFGILMMKQPGLQVAEPKMMEAKNDDGN